MADNAFKTPFVNTLDLFDRRRLGDAFQKYGQMLPVKVTKIISSGICEVAFQINDPVFTTLPPATVPLLGPEYIRYPTQVGDVGYVTASNVDLAPTAGFSTGMANLNQPFNLESLVFVPIANTNWSPVGGSGNATVLYGVSGGGVILQDSKTGSKTTLTLTASGVVIQVASGDSVKVTKGGTPSQVVTVGGNSSVLLADPD
jgi:hypothetical protein